MADNIMTHLPQFPDGRSTGTGTKLSELEPWLHHLLANLTKPFVQYFQIY